jgi:diguanylate cyclase
MMVPHEPWLVALSIAIAMQGSFVGLSLARGLDRAEGFRRRLLLAGASLTLATSVWSMHFVAMLAADFPSAIDYLVLPTLVSFLICVIVVGIGVYAAHADGPSAWRIGAGSVAMGLGISLMHYVGMSAVHLAGPTYQEAPFVVASVAISIAASAIALWTLDRRPTRAGIIGGAVALGLAISGMHYTAMAGMRLDPVCFNVSRFVAAESALSRNALALLTTMISFGVSGAFLLSLVPDHRTQPANAPVATGEARLLPPALAPLAPPETKAPVSAGGQRTHTVRVEREGRALDIPVNDIFGVRANAHYTYVHDGAQEYFCSLAISALEARLDPARFVRVHRSHIIAIDRVSSLRRAGENGVADLAASVQCSTPVARAHFRQVKQLLDARTIRVVA